MSLSKVIPVLETARSFIMTKNWLPRNVNLTFVEMDDRCSNVYSIFRAFNAYSTCAHVFLGPACEYALGESSSLLVIRPCPDRQALTSAVSLFLIKAYFKSGPADRRRWSGHG